MTKEEAIARIKNHKIVHKMNEPRAIYISEALDMAIEALEADLCEDAISRQAVLDLLLQAKKQGLVQLTVPYLESLINQIPPAVLS